MTRVTPRRIVTLIEKTYDWTITPGTYDGVMRQDQAASLGMIAALARELPAELLPTDSDDFTAFVAARTAIESALASWAGPPSTAASPLYPLRAFGNRTPVVVIRDVLKKCPEEAVAEPTHGLEFIRDVPLRASIRKDLGQSRRALDRGDYKAATVLAGAAVEALLLHAIEPVAVEDREAARARWAARSRRPEDATPPKALPSSLEDWKLVHLIWIARCAGVISEEAAAAADVARDFRNLIHPGRERRTRAPSDEGTGLAALGAAVRIAEELSQQPLLPAGTSP